MATRIYVGNLPYSATNDQLAELFGPYGEIVEATVVIDRGTGQSKGFGFVEMATDEAARNADKTRLRSGGASVSRQVSSSLLQHTSIAGKTAHPHIYSMKSVAKRAWRHSRVRGDYHSQEVCSRYGQAQAANPNPSDRARQHAFHAVNIGA
jgi:hypothetical protein